MFSCPHCHKELPLDLPWKPIEHNNAFAQVCTNCGHKVGVRPWIEGDPGIEPEMLTEKEIMHLKFHKNRLKDDIRNQTEAKNEAIN